MKRFKDKKEADEWLAAWKPQWFCPLIRAFCSKECYCYQPPKVESRQKNDSEGTLEYVSHQDKGWCSAPILSNFCAGSGTN